MKWEVSDVSTGTIYTVFDVSVTKTLSGLNTADIGLIEDVPLDTILDVKYDNVIVLRGYVKTKTRNEDGTFRYTIVELATELKNYVLSDNNKYSFIKDGSVDTIIDFVLTGTGWTRGSSDTTDLTISFSFTNAFNALYKILKDLRGHKIWFDNINKVVYFGDSRANKGVMSYLTKEVEEDANKRKVDKVIVIGSYENVYAEFGTGTTAVVYKYVDAKTTDECYMMAQRIYNELQTYYKSITVTSTINPNLDEGDIVSVDEVNYIIYEINYSLHDMTVVLNNPKKSLFEELSDKLIEVTGTVSVATTFDDILSIWSGDVAANTSQQITLPVDPDADYTYYDIKIVLDAPGTTTSGASALTNRLYCLYPRAGLGTPPPTMDVSQKMLYLGSMSIGDHPDMVAAFVIGNISTRGVGTDWDLSLVIATDYITVLPSVNPMYTNDFQCLMYDSYTYYYSFAAVTAEEPLCPEPAWDSLPSHQLFNEKLDISTNTYSQSSTPRNVLATGKFINANKVVYINTGAGTFDVYDFSTSTSTQLTASGYYVRKILVPTTDLAYLIRIDSDATSPVVRFSKYDDATATVSSWMSIVRTISRTGDAYYDGTYVYVVFYAQNGTIGIIRSSDEFSTFEDLVNSVTYTSSSYPIDYRSISCYSTTYPIDTAINPLVCVYNNVVYFVVKENLATTWHLISYDVVSGNYTELYSSNIAFSEIVVNANGIFLISESALEVHYSTDGGVTWNVSKIAPPDAGYTKIHLVRIVSNHDSSFEDVDGNIYLYAMSYGDVPYFSHTTVLGYSYDYNVYKAVIFRFNTSTQTYDLIKDLVSDRTWWVGYPGTTATFSNYAEFPSTGDAYNYEDSIVQIFGFFEGTLSNTTAHFYLTPLTSDSEVWIFPDYFMVLLYVLPEVLKTIPLSPTTDQSSVTFNLDLNGNNLCLIEYSTNSCTGRSEYIYSAVDYINTNGNNILTITPDTDVKVSVYAYVGGVRYG